MNRPTLLIVDDEPHIRRVMHLSLEELGYRVLVAENVAGAREMLDGERVDLVLTDLQLPDATGLDLLAAIRAERPDLPVIVITAFGTVETAVRAMKLGAFDYVLKPFRLDELEASLARALQIRRVERENAYFRETAASEFEGITAESPGMKEVVSSIERVAATNATVLVTGETGTGKELVARAVHARSPRAEALFVALNCAAIPAELLEAELFGVVRGAYTGATEDRPGKFEIADGGTLFLDEIGDMPPAMQAKLLRALQEGAIERLGSNAVRRVDVRIIAATHRDLARRVEDGLFRADLFYRLNVVPIHVPPLRERPEDLEPIARQAVERFARRLGRSMRLGDGVVDALRRYAWPGNVRELNNLLERAVILGDGPVLDHIDLPGARTGPAPVPVRPLRDVVDDAERNAIRVALRAKGDNKTAAAERLGISVRTLWYRIEKLGLGD